MIDLYQAWRSGKVNRMHTMPQLVQENIAEHTWGVLLLILRFWPDCPREFLVWAVLHDAGEVVVGDMPGHVKWSLSEEARAKLEERELEHLRRIVPSTVLDHILDSEQHILLEIFDRAEFCVSCVHEMRMGNYNAAEYFGRAAGRFRELVRQLTDENLRSVALRLKEEMMLISQRYLQHMGSFTYHAFG